MPAWPAVSRSARTSSGSRPPSCGGRRPPAPRRASRRDSRQRGGSTLPWSPGPARDDLSSSTQKVIVVVREGVRIYDHRTPDTGETLDYDRVRLLWPDHLGLARGKYLPREHAAKGTAHCLTLFTLGFDRDMTPHDGALFWQGLPDCDARFDPANVRPGW